MHLSSVFRVRDRIRGCQSSIQDVLEACREFQFTVAQNRIEVLTPVAQAVTEPSTPPCLKPPLQRRPKLRLKTLRRNPVRVVMAWTRSGSSASRAGENLTPHRFRVKYVALDAPISRRRAAGLAEGMKLVVRDLPNSGAVRCGRRGFGRRRRCRELEVLSVAETSSVTEIRVRSVP